MADLDQLYSALRNADAAGDTDGAKKLADYIRTVQSTTSSAKPQDRPDIPVPSYDDVNKRPNIQAGKDPSFMDKVLGAGEAGLNLVSSIPAAIPGGVAALSSILTNGKYGTQEGVKEAEKRFSDVAGQYTYEPRTQVGKQYAENVGNAINDSGIVGVPQMELARLAETSAPAIAAARSAVASKIPRKLPAAVPAQAAEAATEAAPAELAGPVTAQPEASPPLYTLEKGANGDIVSDAEKLSRTQTLQRIGMDQARESALSGDALGGATQAQIAKFIDEPAGIAAREVFDSERRALQNHAQTIARETGGSLGVDETTQNSRGQVIAAPFDGLREYFDTTIDRLYKAADERSNGTPITKLDGLDELLGTDSQFAGKAESGALRKGVRAYLREQGILDSEGTLTQVTSQQAESIKQYLNSQWSPGTSGLIGKIKGIIDNDVFKSAGEDIYAQAREMYKSKKATLDNPSGIAKMFEFDPQTPINRAVPFENIPDKITRLPAAQFGHVIDVLQRITDPVYKTPESLVLQAYDSLNEIRGHMANKLMEIGSKFKGQWNASGVTDYLKNNSAKFGMVFSKEELAKLRDLNDAGHILSVDHSYPGAAAQGNIAMKRGLMSSIAGKGLAGLGGLTGSFGGPMGATAGAAIGSAAGEKFASTIGGNAALKRFNSGIVNLSDSATPAADALKNSSASSILRDAVQAVEESGITSAGQVKALVPYVAPAVGIINSRRN